MDYQYNLQFGKLCSMLDIGDIIKTPKAISGGLLHRMFAVETSKGKYAVKALNPQIMARPTAENNYVMSEKIANIASKHIPAQPANIYNGTILQNIDNQFYLVFDWIEGQSLKPHESTTVHCRMIGSMLAEIHLTDYSQIDYKNENSNVIKEIDWNFYLNKGRENNSNWVNLFSDHIENLFLWNDRAQNSSFMLGEESVFSHRDLDPKNVMWIRNNPIIIDWESAGSINPSHDLIESALYWSINESARIDKEKFHAFVSGYQQRFGNINADWRLALELGYSSKLEWLEYSLKRSLGMECNDEREQEMGTIHVTETINALKGYDEVMPELIAWLENMK
ncbi:phosphotransferase [Paenibacillus solani]|uniref:Aminoglycoside phosphotransferase n=1 Tax=Paenibacillus solani TaxID=1705565 RepID=A0A0M1P8A8_9BACL|nr:phosphotransferase [Paenibacillus solani]KOR90259.1 aminoglycoside phosphotransferase [Paenibacillus solani]